jgi:hypothetical protein
MSGYNPITKGNVTTQQAPTPSQLQRTGALVSQGGTTLTPGTYSLLVLLSSLTPLVPTAFALSGITQTGGLATATIESGSWGIADGVQLHMTISGATGSTTAYNGSFFVTILSTTQFTFAVPGGTATPATGTLSAIPISAPEVQAMVTTFFAQGQGTSVYVLELGAGDSTTGQVALAAFITANPKFFCSYLLPHHWGTDTTFYQDFAINYTSDTAKIYFHVTTTLAFWQANPTVFASTLKCVIAGIEAPTVAAAYAAGTPTEFSRAAFFYVTLNLQPSPANQVTQGAYSFEFGVTPYPTFGNAALFIELETANINYTGTGAEGGITNTIEFYGACLDGNDFNKVWYSIDNVQITLDLNTSNAVINGSNNPSAPLNYNQQGINSLQAVAGSTMQTEIATSLALGTLVLTQMTGQAFAQAEGNGQFLGQVVVNAIPFASYAALEPGAYQAQQYGGMTVLYTPQLGFRQIIYNIVVSFFA